MLNLHDQRPLNAALREAVDFVQAEGWDRPPTLFALVPYQLVADAMDWDEDPDTAASGEEQSGDPGAHRPNPLALVVQEDLPPHILPGSEELGDFIARIRWPEQVVGAILAQEIMFVNSALGDDATPQPARLFTGILDAGGSGAERTVLQLRPTAAELEADPFAQDKVQLLGGEGIAPGVVAALRASFEAEEL